MKKKAREIVIYDEIWHDDVFTAFCGIDTIAYRVRAVAYIEANSVRLSYERTSDMYSDFYKCEAEELFYKSKEEEIEKKFKKVAKTTKLTLELASNIEKGIISIESVWRNLKNDSDTLKTVIYLWNETGYFHLVEKLCIEKYREIFERLYKT